MSTSELGFAIVGTGMIAGYHAQAIRQTAGARLVGVVSRSAETGAAFAARHEIPIVTSSVEAMVARPDVHVITVATPSGAHLEPAVASIRAGKHVMVEKPLEVTPARADQILRAAEEHGVLVGAIFQGRFGPGAQRVKAAIEAGRFGRLVLASAAVKWFRAPEYYATPWKGRWDLDGGGALMNQAIHGVDWLLRLIDLLNPEDEAGRNTPRDAALGSGAGAAGGISIAGHLFQIRDFVAAVRDGHAPAIDGREGRKAVALVHAIYESAKRGTTVAV